MKLLELKRVNSKKSVYVSEHKKCRKSYVCKTQTKFRLKIIKLLPSSSKLRNEKCRNYFKNIIYRMIMKVMSLNNSTNDHKSFKTKEGGTQKLFQEYYIQDDYEDKQVK